MILLEVLRNLLGRPATERYPAVKPQVPPGFRGRVKHDPKLCIYCGLCARSCPSGAIAVDPVKKTWTYDVGKCVFCGHCEDVCRDVPKRNAIKLGPDWELASERRPKPIVSRSSGRSR
jgi:formate hydrogenlyase subunit 6/NADH:ubiquinone oxidoreductase subunit I